MSEIPKGWKLVPEDPDQAMCQAAQWKLREWPKFPFRVVPAYKAMLAAAPAQPETWKVLPSPVRLTGELLHRTYPGFRGAPWEYGMDQAIWNDWAEQLNAWLAAQVDESAKTHAKSPDEIDNLHKQVDATSFEVARDAARYRWLREKLMQSLCGGVEVNDEKMYYEQPKPGEEVRVYWYPNTPIGCYEIRGGDLDSVIDGGMAVYEPTGEPIQEAKE